MKKSLKWGLIIFLIFFIFLAIKGTLLLYPEKETADEIINRFTYEEWKDFSPLTGEFKIRFPINPIHQTDTIPVPHTDLVANFNMYTTGDKINDAIYFIYITESPVDPMEIGVSNPLEIALNGMLLSKLNLKLISSEATTFGEYEALDFLIQEKPGVFMRGKLIMAERTLYQLVVAYESETYKESDYSRFINSFELF